MFICGIDYSISSPAVVKAELDDNLNILSIGYMSFSSTLKNCKIDDNLHHNVKKNFKDDISRFQFLRDKMESYIYGKDVPDYIAIEGYAMGGMGKVFNIAEATSLTKSMIYDHNTPLRIYTPSAIKKYATGNGSANKKMMFDQFNKESQKLLSLSHLQDLTNPQEDIIDAYWIMKLLLTELQLRNGVITLKQLSNKQIEVFNAVSKSQPTNLLVRDFIQKDLT
ncbi:MAG: hypothetical protein DRQ24_10695 [Candidatus Latescibacterota bacterium]|nr:MAG: hypothetical protein DRQ24_10695 [Candidatus Latescibacterota bacterium]